VRSKSLKGYSPVLATFIQVSDILLLVFINLLTWRIYKRIDPNWAPTLTFSLVLFFIVQFVIWFSLLQVANLPKIPRTTRTLVLVFNVLRISFIGLIILFIFKYLFGVWQVTPALIFLFSALAGITYSVAHIVSVRLFKIYRSKGYDIHKVLVFADTYSEDFIRKILEQKEWGFEIVAIISDSRIIKSKFEHIVPVYSSQKDPVEVIKKHVVDEVIYSRYKFNEEEFRKVILYCFKTGIIFRMQSELSPVDDIKIRLDQLHRMPDLVFLNLPGDKISLMFNSFIDHAVSLALVLISLPVFAVIAIAIKLDSPGPVFFLQKRVGLRGREFNLIKFRTMVKNAEE
jgi:FlaA1/EpsC-like NDP-sugar epimerase